MDIAKYNRLAWDQQVAKANRWTVPVSKELVSAAKTGEWDVVLTPEKPVPRTWFPPLRGLNVLCLASGGGQQAPLLAAAGARITVLDNSPRQLEQDQVVARREGLEIKSVLGDTRDLTQFSPDTFDLIFNPCSVSFVPEVQSVFAEAFRVLQPNGLLMCGFVNPVRYIFDEDKLEEGHLDVRHQLPYSDETHLTAEEQDKLRRDHEPFIFSHSLEELISGQLRAGFVLRDLFEDRPDDDTVSKTVPVYFATLAAKGTPRGQDKPCSH